MEDSTLRIKSQKVSKIMDMVGELGLVAAEVVHHKSLKQVKKHRDFMNSVHRLELLIRELQDESSGLRLIPVGSVFQRMQRLVRDLTRQTGKSIELVLEGSETEVDKVIVDALYDPLVHLVRNSADHGLESTEERLAAGKSKKGTITLSASHQGGEFLIEIKDDGKGMNRERILARAIQNGLIKEGEDVDDKVIWSMIFEAGFSTKESVSTLSGRGVGMDVVKNTIVGLRGRMDVDSFEGKGSVVSLFIPLTLAFLDCLIVRIGNCLYAIGIDAVSDVIKINSSDQYTINESNEEIMLKLGKQLIPVCYLQKFYDNKWPLDYHLMEKTLLVVRTPNRAISIPVDDILGQQQITLKPLTGAIENIRAASGCALLSSGDVSIVLDCNQLVNSAL